MFTVDTYLSESIGKGLGVYSVNYIPKGTIVWEYIDGIDLKVHSNKLTELNDIQLKYINKYFWREGDYYYSSPDLSQYQNHSDNINITIYNNDSNIPCSERPMIACRDIQPNEELLVDYSEFDEDYDSYKDNLI